MDTKYELVLAPAAVRALLSLSDQARKELAEALGTELHNGPNGRKEAFYPYGKTYAQTLGEQD